MSNCETPDSSFPMKVDIYYPIVEQGAYGNVKKTWVLDRTVLCYFGHMKRVQEEVKPNVNIVLNKMLMGRVKSDIRLSSKLSKEAVTNVVLTNIRTAGDQEIYIETSGPRSGKSTIYEIESLSPFVDPFGDIEYYSVTIRRSENQATDL